MVMVFAISLLLMVLSGLMLDMHRRSWRVAQADPRLSEGDLRFARSQYRRRTQASGIIGVGPLVPPEPWPMMLYVASLAGACLCIVLLAALDAWASQQNFARLRSEQLAAQIKMARELQRTQKTNDG
jgi:hypothetical protein